MKLFLNDAECRPVGYVLAQRAGEVICLVDSGVVQEVSLGGAPAGAAEQVMAHLAGRRYGQMPMVSFHSDIDRLTKLWKSMGFLGDADVCGEESDLEQIRRGAEVCFLVAPEGSGDSHVLNSMGGINE